MTLAKKNSRTIVVDDVEYRWKVRGRPTYCQAMGWTPLSFVVEADGGQGALLVASLPVAHPSNWLDLPTASVRPGLAAATVRRSLAGGWQPTRPGPAFTVTVPAEGA